MTKTIVASEIPLDKILRAGARRILACRPPGAVFSFAAHCDAHVSPGQAARIIGVVREAILNSIDYSHPAGVPGKISLSTACLADGSIRIDISDDGVGLPEGFDPAFDGGSGLRTMRRASADLGAVLSWESTCLGLALSLTFPGPSPPARAAS